MDNTIEGIKSIIYLGNGFDIASGLKTSYSDFIKSDVFLGLLGTNKLAAYINRMNTDYKWSDVEEMLYSYSIEIGSYNEKENQRFKNEHYQLSMALQDYISNCGCGDNRMEKLVNSWSSLFNILRVISFNYTPHPVLCNLVPDYYHLFRIHGIANYGQINDELKIKLGIDRSMVVSKAHDFLYKDNIKIDNPEMCLGLKPPTKAEETIAKKIVKTEIQPLFDDANVIIIYGCSMGRSDTTYFKYLFENSKDRLFVIYHYTKCEKEKLWNRIIELTSGTFPINNIVFIDSSSDCGFKNDLNQRINSRMAFCQDKIIL